MEHRQSKLTGSGIGKFTACEKISAIAELQVGDLLTAFSPQFNALNLAKVTWIAEDRSRAYALFVNP